MRVGGSERGSALLIVFVFAAIVAISLYMELPVAAFEARRQKEQLLISRGNQYARAVKLFVRKVGRYPSSLKELEDTNRMRFLRHEYKDPFTGKADWRLLHAGPNGAIIDSKVSGGVLLPGMTPGQQNQNAATPTSTTSFGNDSFAKPPQMASTNSGSNAAGDTTPPEVVVQQPKQRPPAVSADGQSGAAGSPADASADAALAVPPSVPGSDNQQQAPGTGRMPNATQSGAPQPGAANSGTQTPGGTGAPTDLKAAMLGQQRSGTGSFGSSQMGTIQGGGIAGVASKAAGQSIKLVNDQDDYSKWEFYYDPSKNLVPGGTGIGGSAPQPQNAQQQNGFGAQTGAAGQSSFGQNSGFGQSSFGQSSSSSSSTNTNGNSGTQSTPPANGGPAPNYLAPLPVPNPSPQQ